MSPSRAGDRALRHDGRLPDVVLAAELFFNAKTLTTILEHGAPLEQARFIRQVKLKGERYWREQPSIPEAAVMKVEGPALRATASETIAGTLGR